VLAGKPRDSRLAAQFLARAGVDALVCASADVLFAALAAWELGAVVLAEEALDKAALARLGALLPAQPPWSDLPVVLFSERSGGSVDSLLVTLGGNVTALERPVRSATLITAVRTALRSRRRQYQLRDVLEEMADATRRLEQQDRRKDEFLAMLGHELRNPLTAILGAVHILQHARGPEVAARQPPIIERQARHLSRLVNDLLDVSRVTLGKITLERHPVDLCEVATRCVQTYQSLASHQLTLAVDRGPVVVDGDLVRLEQVLSNLVTNAIKYTPTGGHVRVSVRREGDEGVLRVKDDGTGIDAELLPSIFDLFTQATPTLDRSRGGLGLGLALVKTLVEHHGGQVHAHSDGLGRGSEFVVRLPLAASGLAPIASADATPTAGAGVWVLVVEDNEDARDTMQLLLEMWGYAVETAADGEEGLDKALTRRPAVAIVDIGLPKLDGYELARQLRARTDRRPRLIAVTGYGQPEDRRQALAAGFDHHLSKPVDAEALALLLRDCASRQTASN